MFTRPRTVPALLAAILAPALPASAGAIIFVDADAPSGGDGTSWAAAYRYVHDALDDANSGDEIRIADGTYFPDASASFPSGTGDVEAMFLVTTSLTLRGGYAGFGAPNPDAHDPAQYVTTVSGDLLENDAPGGLNRTDNARRLIVVDGAADVTIAGLRFVARHETDVFTDSGAIEIDDSVVHVESCTFRDNRGGGRGGAIHTATSALSIAHCHFRHNHAPDGGAGVFVDGGTAFDVASTEFHDNMSGGPGAGVNARECTAPMTFHGVTFQGNFAIAGGGGLFVAYQESVTLERCAFMSNTAQYTGGGVTVGGVGTIAIDACTFIDNSAYVWAGGAELRADSLLMTNSLFSRNRSPEGGGALVSRGCDVVNCSFSQNDGSAVVFDNDNGAAQRFVNCIFHGAEPEQVRPFMDFIVPWPTIDHSCLPGGWPHNGTGNLDADPLFVQAGTDDLRLSVGSPCLDAGDSGAVPSWMTTDLAGNARIENGIVDLGCYEGAFTPGQPAALALDVDPGDVVLVTFSNGLWNPAGELTLIVRNHTGSDDASLLATVTAPLGPVPPWGYAPIGSFIDITTDGMADGEFSVQLLLPIDAATLGATAPLDLDITRVAPTNVWALGVASNSAASPDQPDAIGDRLTSAAPAFPISSNELGDYGAWWDDGAQEGYVWANLDREGRYAYGVPQHRADCMQPPNGIVDFNDLLFVIGAWDRGAGPFDVDNDGTVGATDVVKLIAAWGATP